MIAIRHHEFGTPEVLQVEDLPDPQPGAGEVRIAVRAAGVHLLDTSIRAGESFGAGERPTLPMTPGREVAGVVDAVGDGVDPSWLGARVVTHLGFASGGYAEAAVARADRLHRVPEGLEMGTAVAAIGTGRTATGILRLAEITDRDVAVVTAAAGGLGVLLLQGVRRAGARAVGVVGGSRKAEVARAYGAEAVLDHREPDWALGLEDVVGFGRPTVVFDGVGGEVGRAAFERLAPGGRLVRYGWASGVQNPYADPERRVVDVLGPVMLDVPGGIATLEAQALVAAADGSRVPLVGEAYPLRRADEAHRALESGSTVGKVVLTVDPEG